jgi:3',5'-cyclic AMP phosphodiesterase CpdA
MKIIVSISIFLCIHPALLNSGDSGLSKNEKAKNKSIVVISDTQDPLWIEELFLDSNNNAKARQYLFDSILRSQPDAIFHLGDLVSLGYSDDSWLAFDQWLQKLKTNKIPLYPTLGNHELLIFSDAGEQNFLKRFPFYSKTGYMKQFGPVAFIILNSNFSDLTESEFIEQQEWYKFQIEKCESDTSVKAIIVGCHHPPFTNSKIVNSHEDVQEYILPEYIRSNKSVLFLSGHSHSFEHFHYKGKDFVTMGGGGGLLHPLDVEDESEYDDLFRSTDNKRHFHYLDCLISDEKISISVQMLKRNFSDIESVYKIEYTFPKRYIVEEERKPASTVNGF